MHIFSHIVYGYDTICIVSSFHNINVRKTEIVIRGFYGFHN